MVEVLQWKRSRGKLWDLVRWEPDSVLWEYPAAMQGQAVVVEVLQWKRSRGKLWGLVRWEPDSVLGEYPVEWKEERALGPHIGWPLVGLRCGASRGGVRER